MVSSYFVLLCNNVVVIHDLRIWVAGISFFPEEQENMLLSDGCNMPIEVALQGLFTSSRIRLGLDLVNKLNKAIK